MRGVTAAHGALTVAILGASLAACGGGSGLSKSAIDSKANAICAAEQKANEAIAPPSDLLTDPTDAAKYFDQIEPIVTTATRSLAALKPGSDIRTDWDSFVALKKQQDALLKAIRQKAHAADRSGLDDLNKEPDLAKKVEAAATTTGANTCAEE